MNKLLILVFLILMIACGAQESPSEEVVDKPITTIEEFVLPDADVYLIITDPIGIELGDSNYVFGQIAGINITPAGQIAVLDMQKNSISLFTPEGEFIERIGQQGSGPGEFLLPRGMDFFPDGGLVVSDAMAGKLIYFNSDLEYESDLAGFFPSPPFSIWGLEGGAIVGMKPDYLQNEEGMFMGFTVARWEKGQTEPTVVYHSSMSPFDPSNLSSIQDDFIIFGVAPEGIVFTTSLSTEVYEFIAWSPEGEELFTVTDEDFVRARKTQEEIDLEAEIVNKAMVQQGMPESMANWEPDPYREAIKEESGFGIDQLGRLWVGNGTTTTPSFNVYDMEGNLLFTAALDAGERACTWSVVIEEDKFIAFDADPELYPQVFIGNLPE